MQLISSSLDGNLSYFYFGAIDIMLFTPNTHEKVIEWTYILISFGRKPVK